jgi:hypothetical protein
MQEVSDAGKGVSVQQLVSSLKRGACGAAQLCKINAGSAVVSERAEGGFACGCRAAVQD